MKEFIKKLIPAKVFHWAQQMLERRRLGEVAACSFEASRLRAGHEFRSPMAFLSDPETEQLWPPADQEICGVFAPQRITYAVNPGDRRVLFYLVCALKPQQVLEVGTHIGGSTLYLARALKLASQSGKVTTVDIADVNDPQTGAWKQFGLPMSPSACARRLDCLEQIEFITAPALAFLSQTKRRFDLIFLDGDHSACAVYREVSASLRILNEGGVILLHDYYPRARPLFPDGVVIPGPCLAMERIRSENQAIEVHPLGALPWETKQGSHMTSLALVARRSWTNSE